MMEATITWPWLNQLNKLQNILNFWSQFLYGRHKKKKKKSYGHDHLGNRDQYF